MCRRAKEVPVFACLLGLLLCCPRTDAFSASNPAFSFCHGFGPCPKRLWARAPARLHRLPRWGVPLQCTAAETPEDSASAGVFPTRLSRSLWGGELGAIEALVMGKIIIDEFVLRKQPEAKVVRTGLGGGSPQAALGARLWGARTGLVAPVGQGFAQEMLSPLEIAGVDTQGVSRLKGYVTPHTQIRYEAERMIWTPGEGWDRWMELGREVLPIPKSYANASLLHVITEGAGGAEVDMAEDFMSTKHEMVSDSNGDSHILKIQEDALLASASTGNLSTSLASGAVVNNNCDQGKKGRKKKTAVQGTMAKAASELAARVAAAELAAACAKEESVSAAEVYAQRAGSQRVLSVEPVMHSVTEGTIESLRRITEKATVVSPDWETAVKISKMCSAGKTLAGAESTGMLGQPAVGGGMLGVSGCVLHPHLMGSYAMRKGETYWGGRPVYCLTRGPAGGIQTTYYIYHKTTPGCASRWFMGPQEGSAVACLYVESEAVSPDEIDGPWQEFNSTSGVWIDAPELRVSRALPKLTFNDTKFVSRTILADRGRMIMEIEGSALTRVRSIEFDPRHLKMLIREEELPAVRSRDVALASKYTETSEDADGEFGEDKEEWEEEGLDETEAHGEQEDEDDTHTKIGAEIQNLERSLALKEPLGTARQRALALKAAVRDEGTNNSSKLHNTAAQILQDRDMDGEVPDTTLVTEHEETEETFGSGIQEIVLQDVKAAIILERLCASLGVPWLLEGTQVLSVRVTSAC